MNSNTTQHRHNFSIFRLSIVAFLLLAIVAPIKADAFRSTSPYRIDSRQMDVTQIDPSTSYQSYESTIYEPFNNNGPSKIGGRRNTGGDDDWSGGDVDLGEWGDPTTANPGNQSGESPIGDAWVMLVFAAMAAVVIALRKKQTA